MAVLPPIRKLYSEDYASQKGWIGPFLITLNSFMTSVVSALTQQLTLIDNSTSDIKTITFYSSPTTSSPNSISWSKPVRPIAVMVGNVQLASGGTPVISSAIQVQWQMSGTNQALQITNLVGITPTQTTPYTLTLVCIAG